MDASDVVSFNREVAAVVRKVDCRAAVQKRIRRDSTVEYLEVIILGSIIDIIIMAINEYI